MVRIKIKYLTDVKPLEKIEQGDWIDLRAGYDYKLAKGELKLIKLGVAMELPEGCEAIIAPRSSMTKNFGIIQANSIGIIDNSYCGDSDEWGLFAYAIRDTEIHKNDRICQFRIQDNQPAIEFETVETLGNESRGGWGSTGVK